MQIDMQIVIKSIYSLMAAIFIAAVSSWITVQLSLKKLRKEWVWKSKADAYSTIIEALHNSKASNIAYMKSIEVGAKLSEVRETELDKKARQGRDAIDKAADMGSFLLSQEAVSRLEKYQKELNSISHEQDWYGYLDDNLTATARCLKDMVLIARVDLEV